MERLLFSLFITTVIFIGVFLTVHIYQLLGLRFLILLTATLGIVWWMTDENRLS